MLSEFRLERGAILLGCLLLTGCGGTSSRVSAPELDPDAAAERAMAAYDTNGDGMLSNDELQQAPGLLAAVKRFDLDGDAKVSVDELAGAMQQWKKEGAALVSVACVVRVGGRPLEGATVELVPEEFLGAAFKPAKGTTDGTGRVVPTVADEYLPEAYRGRIEGAFVGIYRVVVTHPKVAIPAKYNTATTLGRVVSRRDQNTMSINL